MAGYVLDTSAILAALKQESGFEAVEQILNLARQTTEESVRVPFLALMEVEYKFLREMTVRQTSYWTSTVLSWPISLRESTPEWRRIAALVKSRGRISLADSWMAALALLEDAELVHKDPEFDEVPGLKAIRLPYDRDIGSTNG